MKEPIMLTTPVIELPAPPRTAWEREYQAFRRRLPGFLAARPAHVARREARQRRALTARFQPGAGPTAGTEVGDGRVERQGYSGKAGHGRGSRLSERLGTRRADTDEEGLVGRVDEALPQ